MATKNREGKTIDTKINPDDDIYNEYRIVLIGKTGSGKSKTGNTLIGETKFQSMSSAVSVTEKCQLGHGTHNGKSLVVVDTPGLYDTQKTEREVLLEIMNCVGLTAPGPTAVVLVLSIGRVTEEEYKAVKKFMLFFGKDILRFMIVLFTRKDEIDRDQMPIDKFVETIPSKLKKVLNWCDNRYIAFDNTANDKQKQDHVDEFFKMVKKMGKKNGHSYYKDKIYQEVEKRILKVEGYDDPKSAKQGFEKLREDIELGRISVFRIIVDALKIAGSMYYEECKRAIERLTGDN